MEVQAEKTWHSLPRRYWTQGQNSLGVDTWPMAGRAGDGAIDSRSPPGRSVRGQDVGPCPASVRAGTILFDGMLPPRLPCAISMSVNAKGAGRA